MAHKSVLCAVQSCLHGLGNQLITENHSLGHGYTAGFVTNNCKQANAQLRMLTHKKLQHEQSANMTVEQMQTVGHSLDLPEGRSGDSCPRPEVHSCPRPQAEGRSELLAEDRSPHSFPRAGQGSAIPVTSKGYLFQLDSSFPVQSAVQCAVV